MAEPNELKELANEAKEGSCQCGRVRYRVEGHPSTLGACHCTECQRQTGSAFGLSWIVPSATFQLLSGKLATFTVTCDSGRKKDCSFCPDCGTRIHHVVQDVPAVMSIKAGTLDDTSWCDPRIHIWTKSKQPWLQLPDGVPSFPEEPPDQT